MAVEKYWQLMELDENNKISIVVIVVSEEETDVKPERSQQLHAK